MAGYVANYSATLDEIIIRKAAPDDAEGTLALMKGIGSEPDNHITYTVEETNVPIERQREIIASSNSPARLYIVAEAEGRIVGDLLCSAEHYRLTSHVAQLGMGIEKNYRHRGLGTKMLREAMAWAASTGIIKRIELDVVATNHVAIRLYEKFGFEIEGRRRKYVLKNGEYIDQLIMGLLL